MDTVWPWKIRAAPSRPAVAGNPHRLRGVLQALAMTAIGLLMYRFFSHRLMAYVVWFLAAVVLAGALFIPALQAAIDRAGRRLGVWVGTGLTYALLVPFFYLVFVPGRLVLWIRRRDPMQRQFPSPEASCWSPRKTKLDERHYRKQFS